MRSLQAALLLVAVGALVSPIALPDPFGLGISASAALLGLVCSALICLPEIAAGRWPRTALDWLVAGYVAFVVFTGIVGVDRQQSLKAAVGVVSLVGLFYSTVIVARATRLAGPVLLVIVIGAAIVELMAFAYHLEVGLAYRPGPYQFPEGWSGYPELGALATIQLGILAAGIVRARGGLQRLSMATLALVAGVQIVFLYSRASWVAALAVGAAAIVLSGDYRKRVLVGATAAVALGALLAISNPSIGALAANLVGAQGPAGVPALGMAAPGARLKLWNESVAMIRDHALHGVGAGNFKPIFESKYNPELNTDSRRGDHAHNLWLHQMAELGIPGGLWFLALWVGGLWMAWRAARGSGSIVPLGVFLALMGTTVSNAIDNIPSTVAGFRIYLVTWVLFGLAAGASTKSAGPAGSSVDTPAERPADALVGS